MVNHKYIIKAIETELKKTHDGTSSGPIYNHIRTFVENYSQDAYFHQMVISSDGKVLSNTQDLAGSTALIGDGNKYSLGNENNKEYDKRYSRDVHVISNIGEWDMSLHSYPPMPNTTDLKEIMHQDSEGNYYVRSQTLVAPDGTSMTIIRGNSFNEENHEQYEALAEYFPKALQDWYDVNRRQPAQARFEELKDEFRTANGREPTFDEVYSGEESLFAQAYAIDDDAPAMKDYVQEDLAPRFEECGVKLKFQNNNHIKYKGADPELSKEQWREELYDSKDYEEYEDIALDVFGDGMPTDW